MASGDTIEEAIRIDNSNELEGMQSEFTQVSNKYGKKNKDWRVDGHVSIEKNGKPYDVMTIVLADGSRKEVYFDTSEFIDK